MNDLKHLIDGVSILATIATLQGLLPPLAALISILWICFQFYHSDPIKQWRKERREIKYRKIKK